MKTLLWTLVVCGVLNTVAIFAAYYLHGSLQPMTNVARLIDAILAAALAVWAIVLLERY